MNTVCSARGEASSRSGRATAAASRTTASSWASSSRLQRNRCHGWAALTGRSTRRQSRTDDTVIGVRRGRRMCESTTGIASSSRARPAGLANLIERLPTAATSAAGRRRPESTAITRS